VINEDEGYVSRVEDFEFIDGAVEALRTLEELGFVLVVVTNQSGIARGYYTEDDFQTLTRWMLAALAARGVMIAGVYHCPHGPEDGCDCRKPQPGLIHEAARELGLDLRRSWLVGDKPRDIQAGRRAGIPNTVLVSGVSRSAEHAHQAPDSKHPAGDLAPSAGSQSPRAPSVDSHGPNDAKPLYVCDCLLDIIPLVRASRQLA
jgi:D-glycero-D-manno-heptose 1,7-bisphosphate phosphatase